MTMRPRNLGPVSNRRISDWIAENSSDPLAMAFANAAAVITQLNACHEIGAWSKCRKIGADKGHLVMWFAAHAAKDAIARGILKNIKRLEKIAASTTS